MATKEIRDAFEEGIEGTPDVLFRVSGFSSAECTWSITWYSDCGEAIEQHQFLLASDYDQVTFSKYELV